MEYSRNVELVMEFCMRVIEKCYEDTSSLREIQFSVYTGEYIHIRVREVRGLGTNS